MNTAKLPYTIIWQYSGAKGQAVSKHRTLDAAEKECLKLQREFSMKWPNPITRTGGYTIIHALSEIE